MNQGKTVFSQLMELLPLHEFRKCVNRHQGHYKVQKFTCLDQYLCMAFAQLTYRESLRDIEACLKSMRSKLYHMGIRGNVARSTLADANDRRPWQIYADYSQFLIGTARELYTNDSYAISVRQGGVLPAASFRFHLAVNALSVRLTVPPTGPAEDFHLLVSAPCRAHE